MNEKELKQYEELKRIPAERLTDSEKVEFEKLEDKHDMQEGIKSAMETYFKDSPLLKTQGNIDISTKREEELLSNPAYALSKRLVGMHRRDENMIKTADPVLVADNDDAGGYLVPQMTENKIYELIPTYGQARQHMSVMPVGGGILKLPKEGTLPTWAWETSGTGENVSIASSKPTFGANTITPAKGKCIVVLSTEMLNDPSVNVGAYVISKIAQARGTGEDSQFFAGTGSPFTGVFASTNTFGGETNLTATNAFTYAKLVDASLAIDQNYLANAKWYGSRTVTAAIRKLVDDQNRPIWEAPFGGNPAQMLGFPYVIVENAPNNTTGDNKPVLLLGNLQNSIIGDVVGGGFSVKILTEATIDGTSLGQNDLVGIRVTARSGFTAGITSLYSAIRHQNT